MTAAGSAVTAAGWPARSLTAAFVPQPIVTTGNADVNISRVVVGWLMHMRQWVLVKVVFQVINGTQRKVIMVNPIVQEFVRKSFVQKGGTIWSKTKMRKRASKLLEWGLKNWTGGDFVVLILIGSTFFSQVCATSDRHSALSQCENADEAIQVIIDELLGRDSEIRRHAPAPDVEMPDVQDEMQEDAAQSGNANGNANGNGTQLRATQQRNVDTLLQVQHLLDVETRQRATRLRIDGDLAISHEDQYSGPTLARLEQEDTMPALPAPANVQMI